MKLLRVATGALALVLLAATAVGASAASSKSLLELEIEGKPLAAGGEVLLVAGYSLGGCYWEEQEFKVTVNHARTDKLVRTGQPSQLTGCDGGTESVEITSTHKMVVRMAPMRIHLGGPCVYGFKEISATFSQTEGGPEIYGSATGTLDKAESAHSAKTCAKTRSTLFDMALSGVEAKLVS